MKKGAVILLGLGILVLAGCDSKQPVEETKIQKEAEVKKETSVEAKNDSDQLTPEEVLARMDAEEGVGVEQGEVSVEIVSPEEEKFIPGQARMYKVEASGLENGSRIYCNWKFYLNQYDEEELYKEKKDTCHFTSTFIESRGDLRVHVDVDVKNSKGEVVQTAEAERKYWVE